jgi:hypothetical protein
VRVGKGASGTTWLTSIRAATRAIAALPETAGNCPQPRGQLEATVHFAASWCGLLSDRWQQHVFDRLQHSMLHEVSALRAGIKNPEL